MAVSSAIYVSSDDGETWSVKYNDVTGASPMELLQPLHSGPVFALRNSINGGISIVRTINGVDFERFDDPAAAAGLTVTPASLAYDLIKDELYIAYTGTTSIYGLLNASQVDVGAANRAVAIAAGSGLLLITGALPHWRRIKASPTSGRGPRTLVANKLTRLP